MNGTNHTFPSSEQMQVSLPTESELHQGREGHFEGICSELSGDK